MKVQFPQVTFSVEPQAATAGAKPEAKSFATALAKASTTANDAPATGGKAAEDVKKTAGDVEKTGDDVKKTAGDGRTGKAENHPVPVKVKNERTEDVPGHAYDEIVAGPRNGMMLNQSGNVRHGRAFVLVERDGRSFHIYGSGRDRQVFEVGREPDDKQATKTTSSSSTGATRARP